MSKPVDGCTRRRLLGAVGPALGLLLSLMAVVRVPYVPLENQAFPDAAEYVDAATNLSRGDGYRTTVESGRLEPPRYPPGFSFFLVPFVRLAATPEQGAEVATRLVALALAASIWLAALLIGGRTSSLLAGGLVAACPFVPDMGRQTLSDGLAACLVVVCLVLLAAKRRRPVLLGIASGATAAVRLPLVIVSAAAVAAVRNKRAALINAAVASLFVIALLVYHSVTFGGPLRTGYSLHLPGVNQFSPKYITASGLEGDGDFVAHSRLGDEIMGWACPCPQDDPMLGLPNIAFYPLLLLGMYWVFTPPLLSLVGVWRLALHRRGPAERFGIAMLVGTFLVVLPYHATGARLAAPAGVVLIVFTAAGLSELLERLVDLGRNRWAERRDGGHG